LNHKLLNTVSHYHFLKVNLKNKLYKHSMMKVGLLRLYLNHLH
jgi:hypothetical protein